MKIYVVTYSIDYETYCDSVWSTSDLAMKRALTLEKKFPNRVFNGYEVYEMTTDQPTS